MSQKTSSCGELRSLSWRIRGIAYLIANQKLDAAPPLDFDELCWGVGQILEELGSAVGATAAALDKPEPRK